MGHGNSKAASEAIKKLSSLELQNIKAVFHELSTENHDGTRAIPEPNMATRRVFAERFSLPGLIGERLFHAFDRDNNGTINLEEFVGGVALCLHGSAHAKCDLLFRMFNFSDEEENAVTEDELKTVLLSSLQSAHTILDTVDDSGETAPRDQERPLVETVSEIVEDAFKTCDKSKDGKLSAKEFSAWLHKNPKIMDNVFGWQCPKPEHGQWANEESTSPTEKTSPVKTLQDLFVGGQNQSFFDTLGAPTEVDKPSPAPPDTSSKNIEPPRSSVESGSGSMKQTETLLKVSSSTEVLNTNTDIPIYGQYDQYSAMWIPSAETSSFLLVIRNGMVKPENIKLTSMAVPCLAIDTPIFDPVKDLLAKFCSEQDNIKREVLNEDAVPQNECGLRQLLNAECWRAALNLMGKLLAKDIQITSVSEVTYSPKTLEMWFCRIALLFKLKMFNHAEVELQAFGNLDSPKMYYEFYPDLYPNQKGSMVPFAFRVLSALLPQHNGRPKESLDKLYYVHSVCGNIIKALQMQTDAKAGVELWRTRLLAVLYYIGNTFVSIKEYRLAIKIFEQIAKVDVENSQALFSGLGRISLQSGDIEKAQFYFKSVEDLVTQSGSPQTDVLINRGLLALTLDAYEEAYKHFLAVKNLDANNAVAVNNAAVSLLFQGRLKEALGILEDIVLKNPENLQEGILFNICTMYELETSHHIQKKQKILNLIAKHKGDGFNVSCLKFP